MNFLRLTGKDKIMNKKMKFYNVAACTPKLKIADPKYNAEQILALVTANADKADLFVFPELSITAYTCADLFLQSLLIDEALSEALRLKEQTGNSALRDKLLVIGLPIRKDNRLFNCAMYLMNGQILGIVPKSFLPNYNEFYEKRWFAEAKDRLSDSITVCGEEIPFTPNFLLRNEELGLTVGTDLCEDLWMSVPPSSVHALYGANLIVNLSASNELISKHKYRSTLVEMQSAKCIAAYVYASAGIEESTTDVVFSGHKIIASNGKRLQDVDYREEITVATIDLEKLANDRIRFNSFMANVPKAEYVTKELVFTTDGTTEYLNPVNPMPFVPKDTKKRKERCEEILDIQANGLCERMKTSGIHKLVIGMSGGLDSTLAFLVSIRACEKLGLTPDNIIAITMPGFGTTSHTHGNASKLMEYFHVDMREVSVVDGSLQNFKDIGHDPQVYDVTYENVQARMRTLILMNTANKEGGLVVGTGDLSELALGWCTYNGDHMSMYAVNVSIPKTLVRYMIEAQAEDYLKNEETKKIGEVLIAICETPISPELLPTDANGNMVQKTEDTIGKYDLHDFFLYQMFRNGFAPKKIFFLAKKAFADNKDVDDKRILDTMRIFYRRFFTQQFKRSCLPDGPKVGSVAVSPRGDLRMPSDAARRLWENELDELAKKQ